MAKLGSFHVVKQAVAAAQADPDAEPTYDTVEFEGQEFRVVNGVPSGLPLLEFADAMQAEDDGSVNMEALAAIYQMLRTCILPADWAHFRKHAARSGADIYDLLPIAQEVWAALMSRPSRGPSGSPDGPSTTGSLSKASSPAPTDRPSKFVVDLPDQSPSVPELRLADGEGANRRPGGRPDLAVPMVSVDDYVRGRVAV